MTVEEVYLSCGGDYEEIKAKFPSDALIARFLKMFVADPNFAELKKKLEDGDVNGAFTAAHNLKGVVLNLALDGLKESVEGITEALRVDDVASAEKFLPSVEAAYLKTVGAIAELTI